MGIWIPFYTSPDAKTFDSLIASVEENQCLARSFKGAVLTGEKSGPPPLTSDVHKENFYKLAKTQEWTTFGEPPGQGAPSLGLPRPAAACRPPAARARRRRGHGPTPASPTRPWLTSAQPAAAPGYITTNYGKAPLDEVLKQLDLWLSPAGWGEVVQGIWVDQVPSKFNEVRPAEAQRGRAAPQRTYGAPRAGANEAGRGLSCCLSPQDFPSSLLPGPPPPPDHPPLL
jgi:hypothetical protein